MKRSLPWLGLAGAALACLIGVAMMGVGAMTFKNAGDARRSAATLYEARLQVTKTQNQMGESDLDEAVAGANTANKSAERVRQITERIADLLHVTRQDAAAIGASSRRGAATVLATRRQSDTAAQALAAIAAYQRSATTSTAKTNRALVRILRALRETNEEFRRPR